MIPKGYWQTATGRLLHFSEMDDSHLVSTERLIRGDGAQPCSHLTPEDRVRALKGARKEMAKRELAALPSLNDLNTFDRDHAIWLLNNNVTMFVAYVIKRKAITEQILRTGIFSTVNGWPPRPEVKNALEALGQIRRKIREIPEIPVHDEESTY